VQVKRDGVRFDYTAKEGKHREITVTDAAIRSTVRLWPQRQRPGRPVLLAAGDRWHVLHSQHVSGYIATHSGGHFTAKEFRTWNATVLMALLLATRHHRRAPGPAGASSPPACAGWPTGSATPDRGPLSYIDPGSSAATRRRGAAGHPGLSGLAACRRGGRSGGGRAPGRRGLTGPSRTPPGTAENGTIGRPECPAPGALYPHSGMTRTRMCGTSGPFN